MTCKIEQKREGGKNEKSDTTESTSIKFIKYKIQIYPTNKAISFISEALKRYSTLNKFLWE